MTPESRQKLRQMLLREESYRQFPYMDTTGHLTIAIGRNLTGRGISLDEALVLLDDDIQYFHDRLSRFLPWFPALDENRQVALVDMCFNLGIQAFLQFADMLAAMECHDFPAAATAMLDSKWAGQVGDRATRLAGIIRTGDIT